MQVWWVAGLALGAAAAVVEQLTGDDFDQRTATGSWLLFMYAPWCSVCSKLSPVFDRVAANYSGEARFAKIDATAAGSTLATRFQVNGYPTLLLKGPDFGIHEYKGPRDAESLSLVASKLDHPLLIKFNKAAAQSPVPTFVLCSTSEEDLTVFGRVAGPLKVSNAFALPDREACRDKAGVIVLVESQVVGHLERIESEAAFTAWVDSERIGVIRELGRGDGDTLGLHQLEGASRRLALLMVPGAGQHADDLKTMRDVAWDLRVHSPGHELYRHFEFVWMDGAKFSVFAKKTFGGVSEGLFVFNSAHLTYYVDSSDAPLSKERMVDFLTRVASGQEELRGGMIDWIMQMLGGAAAYALEFAIGNPSLALACCVLPCLIVYAVCIMPDFTTLPDADPKLTDAERRLRDAFLTNPDDKAHILRLKEDVLNERKQNAGKKMN